jgi:hypothetical protein
VRALKKGKLKLPSADAVSSYEELMKLLEEELGEIGLCT